MTTLPYEWDFDCLEAAALSKPSQVVHQCANCGLAPSTEGSDECLACFVACALVEQPDYLEFARATFSHKPEWLAELAYEWNRQASALAEARKVAA